MDCAALLALCHPDIEKLAQGLAHKPSEALKDAESYLMICLVPAECERKERVAAGGMDGAANNGAGAVDRLVAGRDDLSRRLGWLCGAFGACEHSILVNVLYGLPGAILGLPVARDDHFPFTVGIADALETMIIFPSGETLVGIRSLIKTKSRGAVVRPRSARCARRRRRHYWLIGEALKRRWRLFRHVFSVYGDGCDGSGSSEEGLTVPVEA
jgi:hypothetical protein